VGPVGSLGASWDRRSGSRLWRPVGALVFLYCRVRRGQGLARVLRSHVADLGLLRVLGDHVVASFAGGQCGSGRPYGGPKIDPCAGPEPAPRTS